MKQSKEFQPDEITYNTMIDGCARFGLFDRGVALVEEMQELGVQPSSFTLSVLAKVCTRGRRPEKAFQLCGDLAKRYSLQMNVQVYNNLIHAATSMRNMKRAQEVFEQMLKEGVKTDSRTYTLLIRGCMSCSMIKEAMDILRTGYGIPGTCGAASRPIGGMPSDLLSEAIEAVAEQCGTEHAMQLLQEIRRAPGAKIDPKVQMRLTSTAVNSSKW